jgi:copper chaperone CopZ
MRQRNGIYDESGDENMAITTSKTFTVRGFHCSGCSDNLSTALGNIDGVIRARASFDDAEVEVRFDADRVSEKDLRDQIAKSGFEAD